MALPIKWVGASDNYTPGRTQTVDRLIMHWMVGTLASADATFSNPSRDASAHYGVNGTSIHQYVKETDTAWANGHSNPSLNTNPRSISIEHEGGWMQDNGVRFKPSAATHEMSAQLVADIVRRNPAIKLDRTHIKKHNEVSDTGTECPGSLDVDWIIARAKQLQAGGTMEGTVTVKEHQEVMVALIMDTIEGDPHYRANKPQAFAGHVARLANAKQPLEERRLMKDTMTANGVLNGPAMKSFRADVSAQLAKLKQEPGRLTIIIDQLEGQLVVKDNTIATLNTQAQDRSKTITQQASLLTQRDSELATLRQENLALKEAAMSGDSTQALSGLEMIRLGLKKWLNQPTGGDA